jgi:hypothetical protein
LGFCFSIAERTINGNRIWIDGIESKRKQMTNDVAIVSIEEFQEALEQKLGWCNICEEFTRPNCEPDTDLLDCDICQTFNVSGAELALQREMFVLLH